MPKNMQRLGVIKESGSPWSYPVILTRKNRDLYFCLEYRKLNHVMKKDCIPPVLHSGLTELYSGLSGGTWVSTRLWISSSIGSADFRQETLRRGASSATPVHPAMSKNP
jgi:hypothetical protein